MSDLFGNHIVGFPTRRLICSVMVKVALYMEALQMQVTLHHFKLPNIVKHS